MFVTYTILHRGICALLLGVMVHCLPCTVRSQAMYFGEIAAFTKGLRGSVRSIAVFDTLLPRFEVRGSRPSAWSAWAWFNPQADVTSFGYTPDTSAMSVRMLYSYNEAACISGAVIVFAPSVYDRRSGGVVGVERLVYTYDSLGLPTSVRRYQLPADSMILRVTYTHDSLQRVRTARVERALPHRSRSECVYEYSPTGGWVATDISRYDDDGESTNVTTFDGNGFLVRSQYSSRDGAGRSDGQLQVQMYLNDSLGNPIRMIATWGTKMPDTTIYTYRYDRHGNWIERRRIQRKALSTHVRASGPYRRDEITLRRIEYYPESMAGPSRCRRSTIDEFE